MIKYALQCVHDHGFEAWFADSDAYEIQAKQGLINCPLCNDKRVAKAIMAPYVARKDTQKNSIREAAAPPPDKAFALAKEMVEWVKKNSEDVGWQFANEAQKMLEGETKARPIHGQATTEDIVELVDKGAPIMPLPTIVPKKSLS
jgi:hypothetical protein